MAAAIVDCHAHILDPARFPYSRGPGYKPRSHEVGTRETFAATLEFNHVSHAVLVQPSSYGYDNSAMLDAIACAPNRYRGIAVVPAGAAYKLLDLLALQGVVGLRFNLVSFDPGGLAGAAGAQVLDCIKSLGWVAEIFASDSQWPEVAAIVRRSGVKAIVDHFGVRDAARGVDQPGFRAVLDLARRTRSVIKLSAPFRVSQRPDYGDLAPFAAALIDAFGIDRCIWGADWPFLNLPVPPRYDAALANLNLWVADPAQRGRVLWDNPARIFGLSR